MFVNPGIHGMTRELAHTPKHWRVGNCFRLDQTQYCKTITSDMELIFSFLKIMSTNADEVTKN